MEDQGILISFLGALQASLSVLLTIAYGVIAAQFNLLTGDSSKQISALCVRMFLPALLITNVGRELHSDTAFRYIPVLVWSLIYTLFSMLVGSVATRTFKFPSWLTPALCFNNTTALPLLLIQSLDSTGLLDKLLLSDIDTVPNAVIRAKSYFLVCAIVGNSLTFALGPRLLEEDGLSNHDDGRDKRDAEADGSVHEDETPDVEQGNEHVAANDNHSVSDEQTSLLPDPIVRQGEVASRTVYREGKKRWNRLPPLLQTFLDYCYSFLNAPFIGALLGGTIGLVPPLHRAFFNKSHEGGIFKAWLTDSLANVGGLFASLQVVVVGVKLSSSLRKMKRGEESGKVPLGPAIFVLGTRFVVWPLISISVIYAIASRTTLLSPDPMLWFTMMLMPTGPPAMKLTALADVNNLPDSEKMSIAKFLCISYIVSPLMCFAVVGSLKATQAVMTQ